MSDIGDAIYSRLSNSTAAKALIKKRVYPNTPIDRPKRPFVRYQTIGMMPRPHAMGSDPAVVTDRIQIDIFSDTFEKLVQVDNVLMSLISRWRGTEAGVVVQASFHIDREDSYESDTELYRRRNDFEISWEES